MVFNGIVNDFEFMFSASLPVDNPRPTELKSDDHAFIPTMSNGEGGLPLSGTNGAWTNSAWELQGESEFAPSNDGNADEEAEDLFQALSRPRGGRASLL